RRLRSPAYTIVSKYNPEFHEAPEVIGHPKDNGPAWGWAKEFKREGQILYYEPKDRVSEFQEMIDKKMFKKRSLSLYADLTPRHIGWLGAQPPAVKGLPDTSFSEEAELITFEFSEASAINTVGGIMQRLREWMIGKFGTDAADQVVNNWEIDELKNCMPDEMVAESSTAFSEPTDKGGSMPTQREQELEKQLEDLMRQVAEFSEKLSQKDGEITTAKQRASALETEARRKDFVSFSEGLTKEGKLPPAGVPAVLDFMEILSGVETFDFAEGENKKAAKPVDVFKSFLINFPVILEFGEHATKEKAGGREDSRTATVEFSSANVDEERLEIHNRAMEFCEKDPKLSYREAVIKVINEKEA
nr:hypothetical protein [Nitrospirota bacterium]